FASDHAVLAMGDATLGKYLRVLLVLYMRNDRPRPRLRFGSWSGCTSDGEWDLHRPVLSAAFHIRGGTWKQRRVALEVAAAKRRVEKARKGGLITAAKQRGSLAVLTGKQ